ncbi:MAG: lipopolysaccharide assembly protein LapA domain-containing protein [Spirochaetaceae bacterium]
MLRILIGFVIGAAAVIFAIQNTETASYTFLAWSVAAPEALVVIVLFLGGMVAGWLVSGLGRLTRRRR